MDTSTKDIGIACINCTNVIIVTICGRVYTTNGGSTTPCGTIVTGRAGKISSYTSAVNTFFRFTLIY
jgi:hypothetical protein